MDTPRGLEVLLKKASVDAEFRALLLESRSRACAAIGLELDPAEATMLDSMPVAQLDTIIQQTRVRPEDRRIFLGQAAAVMLAALGAGVSGCKDKVKDQKAPSPNEPQARPATRGHAADNPGRPRPAQPPLPGTPTKNDPGATSTC